MEQAHQQPGGGPPRETITPSEPLEPGDVDQPESWDERVIREGIEAAVTEGRPIDNRTARYIAGQLHDGQASALYALASSGAVQAEVFGELDHGRTEQPPEVRRWLACLTVYCAFRGESGPVDNWTESSEAQDRVDLMAQLNAAGTPLGDVATVRATGLPPEDGEADHFQWDDAARWSPAGDDSSGVQVDTAEQLDELFSDQVDEEFGDVEDLGWYGLVQHVGQPGGAILTVDEHGMRTAVSFASDDLLATRWADITTEYGKFYEQRDAYEAVTGELALTPSGITPRVWVGSLAEYVNGDLHGTWFDATREPADLELAAKHMLRLGRTHTAEEWFIADYDGFGGAELGEYESFETISRIAKGIAEHGEAFAHWAAYVGSESTDEIERFEDHYLGEWESFEAYVSDYLEESDFYRFLEYVPEDMRGYVEVNVAQIARDWAADYHVIELQNGRTGVFDTRA